MKELMRKSILFFFLFVNSAIAQPDFPYIQNFLPKEYKANSQNWSITQDKRGILYIANSQLVLEYDSKNWKKIPVRKGAHVFSLATDSTCRIYVGSEGDFGYLAPDKNGSLVFNSLLGLLKDEDKSFAEVWAINVAKEGIYFNANTHLFLWDGASNITTIKPQTRFNRSFILDGELYISQSRIGLMRMEKGELRLLRNGKFFADKIITGLVKGFERKLIIATKEHGIFTYNPFAPRFRMEEDEQADPLFIINPFETIADKFLIKSKIRGMESIGDNKIVAYGTAGIFIFNFQGELLNIINEEKGLQSNNINKIFFGKDNYLWAATESGISQIDLSSSFSFYKSNTGISGSIQDIVSFDKQIYIASTNGVFVNNKRDKLSDELDASIFKPVENISESSFQFFKYSGNLFVYTSRGLYKIRDDEAINIFENNTSLIVQSPKDSSVFFIAGTQGLQVYKAIRDNFKVYNNNWTIQKKNQIIKENIASIAIDVKKSTDSTTVLWISTSLQGLLRIELDKNFEKKSFEKYGSSNGLPDGEISVFNAGDDIVFGTSRGLYKFLQDSKIKSHLFMPNVTYGEELADSTKRIYRIKQGSDGSLWFVILNNSSEVEVGMSRQDITGKYNCTMLSFKGVEIGTINVIYPLSNKNVFFGGFDGFVKYDYSKAIQRDFLYPVLIREVVSGEDSTIFGGVYCDENMNIDVRQADHEKPRLSYDHNSVSFYFSVPFYEQEQQTTFSYLLDGFDKNWSTWSVEAKKQYTNLPPGNYRFRVKAKNVYEKVSAETVYEFTIVPPWYYEKWAYAGYIVLLVFLVYLIVNMSVARLKASKEKLEKLIRSRTFEVIQQKEKIEEKNKLIEEAYKGIKDSIKYAKRIQQAILPPKEVFNRLFPDSFILYKPKDIVSGDFYWVERWGDQVLIAVVDCTGHGVPGAFMSIVGHNLLNHAVNLHGLTKPSLILNEVNKGLSKLLHQGEEESIAVNDGMDVALCSINYKTMQLQYAGAFNPLWIVRGEELIKIAADKHPVGAYIGVGQRQFTNNEFELQKGDTFYIFSDGYADQFGEKTGKKFKQLQLQQLLLMIQDQSMQDQKNTLMKRLVEWKGRLEQIDDILVIGVKI